MNARTPESHPIAARPRRAGRETGFTLVEVMVTVAVTMVAFTGLATLQILALRAASSTLERTQATALAYEIADRMRLNRGEPGVASSALGGGYDNVTLCNAAARHADDERACQYDALTDLTADDRITQDLRQWWSAIDAARLANWYAGIQSDGDMFAVSVTWDDSRAEKTASGAVHPSCLGGDMPAAVQEVCIMAQL